MQTRSESKGKFSCSTCGKVYATKGTLSRHARNHRRDTTYTCIECNVTFRRRDLLARHVQIHKDRGTASKERQRCHTACLRCRTSRSKCDGGSPCASCSQLGHSCVYRRGDGRVSEADCGIPSPASVTLANGRKNPCDDDVVVVSESIRYPDQDPIIDEEAALYNNCGDAVAFGAVGNDRNVISPEESSRTIGLEGLLEPSSQTNIHDSLDPATSSWPFSTAWQWTHEDLYLQNPELSTVNELFETISVAGESVNTPGHETYQDSHYDRQSPVLPRRENTGRVNTPSQLLAVPQHPNVGRNNDIVWPNASLSDLVEDMITVATEKKDPNGSNRNSDWRPFSAQLSSFIRACNGHSTKSSDSDLLEDLVHQFFKHFHPLWPLILAHEDVRSHSHPVLYLTLTSIGALYSGARIASRYGSLMHNKLRIVLDRLPPRHDQKETDMLDIGRSMLLTQVAALYFEQENAFSAAQRLGAVLNAHAYRMRLFVAQNRYMRNESHSDNRIKDASLAEGRRMLAYGILRAETFMSVLFNRKPTISYEEINLPLPFASCSTDTNQTRTDSNQLMSVSPCGGVLFSDLTRLVLEKDEVLPLLRPIDAELLLFGIQNEVWRFCHDPDLFQRLIGKRRPCPDQCLEPGSPLLFSREFMPSRDHLDRTSKEMRGLTTEYERTLSALYKWRQALSRTQLSHPPDENRFVYLSALILLELSYLRLYAPVDLIQQAAYQIHDPSTRDEIISNQILEWTFTDEAVKAIAHSREIVLLLKKEISRPLERQAKYNILALIALHHAAATIWAIAGTNNYPNQSFLPADGDSTAETGMLTLQRRNTNALMLQFLDLFSKITWTWGFQSSFSKMVRKLADQYFPMPY